MPRKSASPQNAKEWLLERHEFYGSWSAVAEELGEKAGGRAFNRSLLWAIAKRNKSAPPSVLRALGLPVTAPAPICPRCGVVHVARTCPARDRFAERAAHYDLWRARHAAAIARITAWAESQV